MTAPVATVVLVGGTALRGQEPSSRTGRGLRRAVGSETVVGTGAIDGSSPPHRRDLRGDRRHRARGRDRRRCDRRPGSRRGARGRGEPARRLDLPRGRGPGVPRDLGVRGFAIHGELALLVGGVAAERGDASLPGMIVLVCGGRGGGGPREPLPAAVSAGRSSTATAAASGSAPPGSPASTASSRATAARPCSSAASPASCGSRCRSSRARRGSPCDGSCPTASPARWCGQEPSSRSATPSPSPSPARATPPRGSPWSGILLYTAATRCCAVHGWARSDG